MLRFVPIFLTTLFLSLNFGALLYVNSSYLSQFFTAEMVSLLFLLGAVANIAVFLLAPRLLHRFGKQWLLLFFLLILALSTSVLASGVAPFAVASAFVIYSGMLFVVYYCLDIFLEEESVNKHTGEIRGLYLTTLNAGIALGPLLLSLLKIGENLSRLYSVAVLLLIIPLCLSIYLLLTHRHHNGVRKNHALHFRRWWQNRSLRAVTLAKVCLEIFFAVMVIYTPLYLHDSLGFTWAELGIIFAVMLLPFVFLEWPAGELADRFWGEKEMMSVGFFIIGLSLLFMPFLSKVFATWLVVLLASRLGAALVEVMTESYFFKKIDAADTGLISIFRLARPTGIIIGSVMGAVSLNLFSLEKIFFIVALVVFFGMREALYIKDTL